MSEKIKVEWGNHSFAGNAEKVYLEIRSIGDDVKPQQMVDFAKNDPDSELHKCFTWDNDIAADKYRLYEARQIACNLIVKYEKADNNNTVPQTARILHRASTSRDAGYKPLPIIVKNEDLYQGLLLECKTKLKEFKNKYQNLTELQNIWDLIDEL